MSDLDLYLRLGERPGIASIVEDFYHRVLADEALSRYFTGVSMPEQRRHMTAFLASALGGPDGYRGRDLAEAHRDLSISGGDFDAVAGTLAESLREHDVGPDDIATVLSRVSGLREQIVTAGR